MTAVTADISARSSRACFTRARMQAVPKTGPMLYLLRTDTRLIAIDADIAPTACMPLFEELLRMLK